MELKELYDKLIAEGCKRFYIEGVGGPQDDDVERLGMYNGVTWEVCYFERGQPGKVFFSSPDKDAAIQFYYNHVIKMQHWHLIAFTRSLHIVGSYKDKLESHGIKTVQNDITAYATQNDRVYRLFVINKDIFKAKELFNVVPYFDENLKR